MNDNDINWETMICGLLLVLLSIINNRVHSVDHLALCIVYWKKRISGASILPSIFPLFYPLKCLYFTLYGHFSWIYFFNNECADGTLTLWQFLSEH